MELFLRQMGVGVIYLFLKLAQPLRLRLQPIEQDLLFLLFFFLFFYCQFFYPLLLLL